MQNSRKALICLLVLIGAASLMVIYWPHEPSYGGKPLSYWLQYTDSLSLQDQRAANTALRKMGPPALSAIVKRVVTKDLPWKKKLIEMLAKQTFIKIRIHSWDSQRWRAAKGFEAFGPSASSATPTLIRALRDSDANVRRCAAHALGCIGPQAKDAIPELIRLLTVGEDVTWALGAIGPAAVPNLLEIINGGPSNIQYNALAALGSVLDNVNGESTGMEVSAIVPVLIPRLNDLEPSVRRLSALLLGLCGTKAKAALPDLLRVSKDQDEEVSRAAMIALHEIGYSKTLMLPAATKSLLEAK